MFTGIIESLGIINQIEAEQQNLNITITSTLTNELKIDQSVSHNGICLTVIAIKEDQYTVTAIHETILKTTIAEWKVGDLVNLERAMFMNARLDGHIVQGHVDQIGVCTLVEETSGSWAYEFMYDTSYKNVTIEKGSITVNGVSLTVVDSNESSFKVAIIPYTYEHTNFNRFQIGTKVNLEFDVIGKYVAKLFYAHQ
jgi:riboflavin synthase